MLTSYVLWDDKNRPMETFAGPCRLAAWADVPEGWTIERFLGDVSQGMVAHADVKAHADTIWRAYTPPLLTNEGDNDPERSDCPGF